MNLWLYTLVQWEGGLMDSALLKVVLIDYAHVAQLY